MRQDTLPASHFADLYAARSDPWHLAESPYERGKRDATMAALPRPRYGKALEIGCANGDLTACLADRCDNLLAIEPVEAALNVARRKAASRAWVRFASMFVPADWPDETFDLVILSEVLDYLGTDDVAALSRKVWLALEPAGEAVLVHWVGKKSGPPSGREASDLFIADAERRFEILRADRNANYRLDVLRRLE